MAWSQPSPRLILAAGLATLTFLLAFTLFSDSSPINLRNTEFTSPKITGGHHSAPEHVAPEHAVPEHAAPEHVAVEHTTPEHAAPEHAAPEHVALEHGDLLDDIQNSTLGFQKIFVVGLPERTDRRDAMVLQARLSNIDIEFIDGVHGDTIPDKAIPKESEHGRMDDGKLGCWRVHVDAMQRIVHQNITSALIIEDDADWDVRIREMLRDAALASQALTQPLKGTNDRYADASYRPRTEVDKKKHTTINSIDFEHLPQVEPARISPYGDNWELFWTGHCGTHFPDQQTNLPRGRVIKRNDITVPPTSRWPSVVHPNHLHDQYPFGTRVYHHPQDALCTLSYAVSQAGAQALLRDMGLNDVSRTSDSVIRDFCNGQDVSGHYTCIAATPPILNHFRPKGPMDHTSNIDTSYKGWRQKGFSEGIRWSVRLNADRIIRGDPMQEQFPEDYTKEALAKNDQGKNPPK